MQRFYGQAFSWRLVFSQANELDTWLKWQLDKNINTAATESDF